MSATRGATTIVTPLATIAGSWKQSDFPPPVGITRKTSRPERRAFMHDSWNGLKDVRPKELFKWEVKDSLHGKAAKRNNFETRNR